MVGTLKWCVVAVACAGALHAQSVKVPVAQEILNQLATPLAESSFNPPLPPLFANWTVAQKNAVPREISGRCGVAYLLMNPGGKTRLLPPEMGGETNTLMLSVCMAGKMPRDWIGRASAVSTAKDILDRAGQLGVALKMPESLRQ
jgi:hypothetical protein